MNSGAILFGPASDRRSPMGYKEEQEAFVSGLKGSSLETVVLVGLSTTISCMVRSAIEEQMSKRGRVSAPVLVGLDILFVLFPSLLNLCFSATFVNYWNGLMLILFVILYCLTPPPVPETFAARPQLPFLTTYRSSLLFLTCFAILAVDFHIFPRYFAKTETFGWSLMDAGVGSFVFSNAIVSKAARHGAERRTQVSYGRRILVALRGVSPLLFLGFMRLLSTKATDYQEHVSEYGVHWNFFFTLSVVSLMVTLLEPTANQCLVWAIFLGTVYQVCLSQGVEEWILEAPRDTLLSANKEGICSSIGFLCICFLGTWVGSLLFGHYRQGSPRSLLPRIVFVDLMFWIACIGLSPYFPASRRMANMTYVLFVVAYNTLLVILFWQASYRFPRVSLLHASLSRNGLFMFLASNLMTGATNLSMKTLYASDEVALLVLSAYALAITTLSIFLHHFKITLKFW